MRNRLLGDQQVDVAHLGGEAARPVAVAVAEPLLTALMAVGTQNSGNLQLDQLLQTKAMLKAIRQRWSIENSWHWVRDVPLREDAHRYRENNGVQILATLRSMAINALRLEGIWSITEGIAALAHDIKGLLRLLGWRSAAETPSE